MRDTECHQQVDLLGQVLREGKRALLDLSPGMLRITRAQLTDAIRIAVEPENTPAAEERGNRRHSAICVDDRIARMHQWSNDLSDPVAAIGWGAEISPCLS